MARVVIALSLLFSLSFGDEYRLVAENFIDFSGSSKEIISSEKLISNNKDVGYIFYLSEGGYIVVPTSKNASPIKAFSWNSGKLLSQYRYFLAKELERQLYIEPKEGSNSLDKWNFLLTYVKSDRSLKSYIPDTYLLSTTWNQGYPYNKFFPKVGDDTTLTGCVQTATAQLMKYHNYPNFGEGVETHSADILDSNKNIDHTEELKAVLYRNYNWELMPDSFSSDYNTSQADEVGYLMRDLAILNKASIGIAETGASLNIDSFIKDFKYSTEIESASTSSHSYSDILTIIKEQVDLELPVLLSLPGHMLVADGYRDDATGSYIHLNMGWGGSSNDFYNMDEDISAGGYSFQQVSSNDLNIIYNIKPCSESAGDCYINLENNSSNIEKVVDYNNTTLESGEDIGDFINNSLESGDEINNSTISGQLSSIQDSDKFYVYLSGDSEVSRATSYYNIALYSLDGTLLGESMTDSLSFQSLDSGKYIVEVSGTTSTGSFYNFDTKDYSLNISTNSLTSDEIDTINQNSYMQTLSGELDSENDIDKFEIYLDGDISILRDSKYYNIALYTLDGTLLGESMTDSLNFQSLDSGKYILKLSSSNSTGNYYPNFTGSQYSLALIGREISENEKISIDNSINRFQVVGTLHEFGDVDEFELYLNGETDIIRDGSSYNIALYDNNGTLLGESRSENLNFDLPLGKYILRYSFRNSSGVYSVINPYYKEYRTTIYTDPVSDIEIDEIETELNSPPEIDMELPDRAISQSVDILLNIYDENGDEVNLSVYGKSDIVDLKLNKNILSINPLQMNSASDIVVKAVSKDHEIEKRFTLLTLSEEIGFGEEFKISGKFLNGSDIYSHSAILEGDCSISGYRGYSNQSFFTSLKDDENSTVADWSNSQLNISGATKSIYQVDASITNPSTGVYYSYSDDFSLYTLSVQCPSSSVEIGDVADILGIDMSSRGDFSIDSGDENSSTSTTLYLSLESGWNLVSSPIAEETSVSDLDSGDINYIFGYIDGNWEVWANGNYDTTSFQLFDNIVAERGYWFNSQKASELQFIGTEVTCPDMSTLDSGWYLLGGCSTSDIGSIFSQNGSILLVYGYKNGEWRVAGSNQQINDLISNSGLSTLSELNSRDGFWIYIN